MAGEFRLLKEPYASAITKTACRDLEQLTAGAAFAFVKDCPHAAAPYAPYVVSKVRWTK